MSEDDNYGKVTNICLDVINSKTTAVKAFEQIVDYCNEDVTICSVLLDVLVIAEGETDNTPDKTIAKSNFLSFVNLIGNNIIPLELLRLELDCFDASKQELGKALIRLKTKVYFKQLKFNLFREESEGYSKLITELIEAENSTNENHANVVKNRILSLIGQFNLDPNRVTDVILECFESCPKQKVFFISLLKDIEAVKEYLCALLGFKFTFYQGPNKKTPFSLYVLAAELIEHDMVDMMKILAFLIPKTESIKEGHRARMTNAQERSSKAETISTASMPISDSRAFDENGPASTATTQTISFTTVIQIQENEDEKLAEPFSEENVLATNQKLGLACALLENGNWRQAQMLIDRLPEFYAVQASPRLCRALCKVIEHAIDGFYRLSCSKNLFMDASKVKKYENYENGLRCINSWEELGKLSGILWYLGPRIAYRSTANVKLLRLFINYYQKVDRNELPKNENLNRVFIEVISECLLPSLTLSETNVALSEELWQLMQMFPYSWRYWMYSKWNQETQRHPEMNIVRGKIYGRTKYCLKRLSKETVKLMGRQLGKLCHIHPTTVLSYLLSQVQTFDNLIGPVVEGLRFLSSLEFDILTYCIISQLADPSKQALKSTDATLSPWLQALGTLVGSLYRRYPLELSGMLDYVLNQLKLCKSFDLLLLREIIQNMSWIESGNAATKEQIEALGGGELLRQEAGGYSTTKNKRAAQRLRESLVKGDLAVGLCISIAQQKDYIVYKESSNLPLKLVGEMVDQCGDTLQQLTSFLVSYMKGDEYCNRFPSILELLTNYSLSIESTMSISRPSFMHKVYESFEVEKKKLKAMDEQKTKLEPAQLTILYNASLETELDDLRYLFAKSIPDFIDDRVPKKFFTIFWALGMYDVDVPTAAYDRTIENMKKQLKDEDHSKLKRAEEKFKHMETKLRDEQKKQTEHVERVKKYIMSVKETLLEEKCPKDVLETFLQGCIIPRALFSELDAVFCARFYFLMHTCKIPFFPSILVMDRIFDNILPLISGLTETEANSLSRFIEIVLSTVQRWHSEIGIYEAECGGHPGMVTKNQIMDYQTFRKLCFRWQSRMTKLFTVVLSREDVDYVTIRNCLILMTKLTPCFPLLSTGVTQMEAIAVKVRDREKGKRDDLSLKAASYVGRLKVRNVKVYTVANQFANVQAKPEKLKKEKTEGEPTGKKPRIEDKGATEKEKNENVEKQTNDEKVNENGSEKADVNNEDGKEKKKRVAKTGLYVPPRKTNEKVITSTKKEDNGEEEGELRTPSPPPVKKSRIQDRIKRGDDITVDKKEVVGNTEKKKRDWSSDRKDEKKDKEGITKERKTGERGDRKKEKANGEVKKDIKVRERSKDIDRKKEDREMAGPALPDSLSKNNSSKDDKKASRKSLESDELKRKERKEKERDKEDVLKASKIAEPVRNRDRPRERSSR